MRRYAVIFLTGLIVAEFAFPPALAVASSRMPVRPVIASISPAFGSEAGRTAVIIKGVGFALGTDRSRVHFGHTSVWARCLSSTECVAVAPTGQGTVRVTLSTHRSTSRATSLAHFSYIRPLSAATWTISTALQLTTTTVEAGGSIPGSLLVTNPGPEVLVSGCGPQFAVALTNSEIPLEVAFATSACLSNGVLIKSGTSTYPFLLRSSYGSCTMNASNATTKTPFCGTPPGDVPLPAGQYQAEFVSGGFGVPAPTSVPVAVVS